MISFYSNTLFFQQVTETKLAHSDDATQVELGKGANELDP